MQISFSAAVSKRVELNKSAVPSADYSLRSCPFPWSLSPRKEKRIHCGSVRPVRIEMKLLGGLIMGDYISVPQGEMGATN